MIWGDIIVVFISCFSLLLIIRNVSLKLNLVDKPNYRKTHSNNTPLVGGVSIYFSILFFNFYNADSVDHSAMFMAGSALLLFVGVLDDRYDLPVLPRIVAQAVAGVIIMIDGVYLCSLGEVWFGNEVLLGSAGYFITLLAIWAAINAFNMVDGIDGLLGGLGITTFTGLLIIFSLAGMPKLVNYCLIFIAALLPFIFLNIGFPFGSRLKIFMGDAGSTFIGFSIIWFIMIASQGDPQRHVIAPATGLWFISVPLIDMVAVMMERILRRKNPFRPDRTHLHHLLITYGFSHFKTLVIILIFSILGMIMGVLMEVCHVNEMFSVFVFILVFFVFLICRNILSRLSVKNKVLNF